MREIKSFNSLFKLVFVFCVIFSLDIANKIYNSFDLSSLSLLVSLVIQLCIACIITLFFIFGLFQTYKFCWSNYLYFVIISFFCTKSITFYLTASKNIIWLFVFFFSYLVNQKSFSTNKSPRVKLFSIIFSLIISTFAFIGWQMHTYERLEILYFTWWGYYKLSTLSQFLVCYIGHIVMIYSIASILISYILNYSFSRRCDTDLAESSLTKRFIAYFIIIFACFFPFFLGFFPGITSPDSISELSQQLGLSTLSNHHPLMHQLFIKLALSLGSNTTSGVGIYSITQLTIMSFCFAFASIKSFNWGSGKTTSLILCLWYGLFMINGLYCARIEKDVLFGVIALLLVILLLDLIDNKSSTSRKSSLLKRTILIIVSFLFCTMRNNGYYAFILGIPFIFIFNKSARKPLLLIFSITLILVNGYYHIIFDYIGVEKSRSAEALSVPLQQIALTIDRSPDELESNSEDICSLREIFYDIDNLPNIRNPYLSDPIKSTDSFNSERFDSDPVKYFKAWLSLGIRHPREYIDAFLLQSLGYYYPNIDYWISNMNILENDFGLALNYRFSSLRDLLTNEIDYIVNNSVFSILYSAGFAVWIVIFCFITLLAKGRIDIASPLFLIIGVWLTTLLSPVYCEYRYIYSISTIAPFYLLISITATPKDKILEDINVS